MLAQEKEEEWDQEKRKDSAAHLAPRFLRASALVWQSGLVLVHWLAPVLVRRSEAARLGLGLALVSALQKALA